MVIIASSGNKKTRFSLMGSLVFCFLFIGCGTDNKKTAAPVSLEWKNNKPTGIIVPRSMLHDIPVDSIENSLVVRLAGNTTVILGNYSINDDSVVFRTLIPFSRGLHYEILLKDQVIGKIAIPEAGHENKPEIRAVYPTGDTLPENLLKMHIHFATSMQEGESLKNILLIKNGKDTLRSVFLDLEPELWNNEKTILTLWLDPGRIKRDLQPNRKMGSPLRKGGFYELIIGPDWQSTDGVTLRQPFRKKFVVGSRDDRSPDPSQWSIQLPKAGTDDELKISFNEPLDFVLLENTIHVTDENGHILEGRNVIKVEEACITFNPLASWKPGSYAIEVDAALEDLAGNNLERLFDNDLSLPKKTKEQKVFKRAFVIR